MHLHDWSTGGLLLVCPLVSFAKFHTSDKLATCYDTPDRLDMSTTSS